ncbi:MAG: VacJ family lipoprotein [Pseudomonadota bacterium]|nr:VacJ family lipoprotein [Pseudomonadota bacterium]
MNRLPLFKFPVLTILLLGFVLNGCATTNKTNKIAKESAATNTNVTTNTGGDSASGNGTVDTNASANTTPSANIGASTDKNAPADSSAITNNRKDSKESFSGPVFKNAGPTTYPTYDKKDPWEPMNRAVFKFNESVDDYLFRPVAKGYKWVTPVPIQMVIGNVYSNFNDIPVTLNNLLQLKFQEALRSSMRVVVNTSFGLGGIIDLASDIGLEKRDEDFGQTLGHHGVASGPYLVLPFLGPSSTRDVGGRVLDIAADPVFIGSFFVAPFIGPAVGAIRAADTRAGLLKSEKTLDEAALDKYEFVRDAYLQRRRSLIYDGNPPKRKDDEDD